MITYCIVNGWFFYYLITVSTNYNDWPIEFTHVTKCVWHMMPKQDVKQNTWSWYMSQWCHILQCKIYELLCFQYTFLAKNKITKESIVIILLQPEVWFYAHNWFSYTLGSYVMILFVINVINVIKVINGAW